jgi:hypothetical protein
MKFPPGMIGVPKFWKKVSASHPNTEVFFGDEAHNKGIGVVRK